MTLTRYPGYTPMNVAKDAKYSVNTAGEVRLEYQEDARVRFLLSTERHPDLVEMVNSVKKELTGQRGGAFYINEFKAASYRMAVVAAASGRATIARRSSSATEICSSAPWRLVSYGPATYGQVRG